MTGLNGKKVLIIQTAFVGDVILATSLVDKLRSVYPEAEIHFLLRKGNEGLLSQDPRVNKLLIWDKKKDKYLALWKIFRKIRKEKYNLLINIQRFLSTGLLTAFSGAEITSGFKKNPLSFLFSKRYYHTIVNGTHEIDRNHQLIAGYTDNVAARPKIHINESIKKRITGYQENKYICIAPTSVWFTKQYPESRWIELLNKIERSIKIYLLGGPEDTFLCSRLVNQSTHNRVVNLAGQLSFLESAALMKGAEMNYVNDSAPLHLASAVNAPVTAIFCSTIPEFGFSPLSEVSRVIQVDYPLDCRPCGLHGRSRCPKGHFKCALGISVDSLLETIPKSKYS